MNFLGNLFGSLTSGLIRLAVAAGILFLCYLFIIKPVLNTTDKAIKASGIEEIGKTFDSVNRRVQREIRQALRTTDERPANRRRLVRCIKRSRGNVKRIERCARRF
jgi:maltooligosyltrehalose synthase